MPTYKTPDVYVEEISVLPRSVAEVATAIPAFVGYTEKDSHQQVSLVNKPRAVASLVEFESIFGRGPVTEVTELILDSAQNVVSATFDNKYYLYESIRLYFANGGARVYIVSAGRCARMAMSSATPSRTPWMRCANATSPRCSWRPMPSVCRRLISRGCSRRC